MSPLLAALLRQHPAQWAAAGDALAAVARRAAARSFLPRLDPHARARAHTTAGFGEVWAVAARVAASGVFSSAGGSSAAVARVSAGPARFAAAVFANLRAPSALFVLGHHARDAVLARRLPNFSGVLVMLLVGGRGFAPATALCLERRAARGADEGKRDRSSADEGSRSIGRVLVPANGAERSWMDGVSPSFRDLVERALTALRALHLSVLFAPAVALAPLLLYAGGDAGAALWYRLLRRTLELGGAAFIKWGQWASTRYDVFPAQLCRELEELQASAPEHSWRRTKQILERAYGAEQVEEIFVWMDPRPIASGSIAQIHRAKLKIGVAEANGGGPELGFQQRLLRSAQAGVELLASGEWRRVGYSVMEEWRQSAGKWEWNPGSFIGSVGPSGDEDAASGKTATDQDPSSTGSRRNPKPKPRAEDSKRGGFHPLEGPEGDEEEGRYVAVKVRHPGVVDALRRDFAILMWLATATRGVSFLQPFQLEHTVQQFGVHMLQQVDLTKEASNLRKFKDCFSLWPAVSFPTPVQGLATEEVLIETFEDGVSISNFLMDPLPAEAMDELIRRHEAEERAVGGLNITGITGGVGGGRGTPGSDKVEEAEAKAAAAQAYADAVRVPEENKVLAALGVRTLLKMLIDDNFLHADLHPGNILVRLRGGMVDGVRAESDEGSSSRRGGEPDEGSSAPAKDGDATGATGGGSSRGTPEIKPEIVILDTGLATELTPMQQASLAEFFQAIISWDGLGVAEKIISFSSNVSPTLDVEAFKRDISTAVNRFSESTPRAGDCMSAIFETVQRYHVTIDPNVMVAVVTVMVLEGWQFRLDPTINILDYIGDVLRSSSRKHQRLTMVDFALRDMWAPFSEPNALSLDRSGRTSPLSSQMEQGHGGGWNV